MLPDTAQMTTQASAEQKHEMSEGGTTIAAATIQALSRARIAQVDPSDQLADVLLLPEHLRDARRRMASAS